MLVYKFVVPKKLPLCNPDNKITELFSICDDVSKVFDNTFGYAAAALRLFGSFAAFSFVQKYKVTTNHTNHTN